MSKEKPADMDFASAEKRAGNEFEDVDGSTTYFLHSFLLLSFRLMNRALDWYTSFFHLTNKDKAKLYRNLSQHFIKRGSPQKAMQYIKQWSKIEKTDPEPFFQLGVAQASVGETELALNAFDKALKLRPRHVKSLYRKSALLLQMKKHAEAIAGLRSIVAESPDDPRAHYLLALAYDGDGQLDKAVAALQQAVALDPEEIKHHQYLGFLNVRREDHKTAAEHFTKVMELERREEEDDN